MERAAKPIIGFSGYDPSFCEQNGPVLSVNRLARAVLEQGRVEVRRASAWKNDLNIFIVQAPRFTLKPFVIRVDGIAVDLMHTLGNTERLNARIFKAIDASAGIFYISDFSRQLIEHFHGVPTQPYTVIHNSTDIDAFSPEGDNMRSKLGWAEEDTVLVTSARWRRWKRLPETLELFRRIKASFPGRFRLLVLGADGHVPTGDPDVFYAGCIRPTELPPWYRTGDLYLHLATLEACGNTQIEAMACGLPVLCGNNGGIGETVTRANGGIVSCFDEPYGFTQVDHYNPPPPDYAVALEDFGRLLSDLPRYREGIRREALDVREAAGRLVDFLAEVMTRRA
jgi:glycosyltransferase involved in cell wall biosynthesis